MHPALHHVDHRPWPLPKTPWTGRQRWCDLLFAHWPMPVAALRPLVPESLEIEEFEGTSWVGVVPFRMEGVMMRGLPELPGISAFLELNLRLYVSYQGRPGVWFLSLDASNPPAVWAARTFFHLPYFRAQMRLQAAQDRIHYQSQRQVGGFRFEAEYGPEGPVEKASAGSLDHWLTERYRLYTQTPNGDLYEAHIHHPPWPLQPASTEIAINELGTAFGLAVEGPPPLVHFSRSIPVVVWPLQQVSENV